MMTTGHVHVISLLFYYFTLYLYCFIGLSIALIIYIFDEVCTLPGIYRSLNVNVKFVIGNLHLLYNAITMLVYLMRNIHQLNYSIAVMCL